jgi:hypothetical protein
MAAYLELCGDAMSLGGRPDDAYEVVRDAVADIPDSFGRSKVIGLAAARAGDRDTALTESYTLAHHHEPRAFGETDYLRARIAALVGDQREAVRLLRRAIINGFYDYQMLRACPDLESLRNNPEYRRLIEPKG